MSGITKTNYQAVGDIRIKDIQGASKALQNIGIGALKGDKSLPQGTVDTFTKMIEDQGKSADAAKMIGSNLANATLNAFQNPSDQNAVSSLKMTFADAGLSQDDVKNLLESVKPTST